MMNSFLFRVIMAAVILTGANLRPARADSCLNPEFAAVRTFPVGGQFPFAGALVVTDINGDTNLDVVTLGIGCPGCTPATTNTLSAFFGNGDGTFGTNVVIRADSQLGSYLTAGDFNGDNRPDLVAMRTSGVAVDVLLNNGNGTFAAPTSVTVSNTGVYTVVVDLNGDGSLDLVAGGSHVALGNGNGTFQPAASILSGFLSSPSAIADFDQDGTNDVAGSFLEIISGKTAVHTLLGGGPPFTTLTNSPVTVLFGAVAAGRFNGDNFPDIAGVSTGKFVGVCLNNGDGTFQPNVNYALPSNALHVVAADFNNDNKGDLAVLTVDATISILMGNGDGTFQAAINYPYDGNAIPNRFATGDVNGDGFPDIVAPAGDGRVGIMVLLNNGDGTFQVASSYATRRGPYRPQAADFNGDGKRDLVVVNNFTNGVVVLLNNGDGTFGTNVYYNTGRQAQSVATGDFNKDGTPDLIVAASLSNRVAFLVGNGNGTFKTNILITSSDLAGGAWNAVAGDFTGDGNLDFAVTTLFGEAVFPGNGNGTFKTNSVTTLTPVSVSSDNVVTGDFNNDTKLDIAYSRTGSNVVCVKLGNGNGGFGVNNNFPMLTNMYGVAAADFNTDGKLDLVTAHYSPGSYTIRLGNGNGTFQSPVNHPVPASVLEGVVAADFNGDGKPDLAFIDAVTSSVLVLLGIGDGTFETPLHFNVQLLPESLTAADLDGNGTVDIVTANKADDTVSVLLNNCPFAPPGNLSLALTPLLATNNVSTAHTVTATVTSNGTAAVALLVNFSVTAGPNLGQSGTATTSVAGQGSFTYTGSATPGTDTIRAIAGGATGTVTKVWIAGSGCPTITVSPTTLPAGTVGTAYNQAITATGGQAPRTFAVTTGTLPGGLNLSNAGTLSGTPTNQVVAGFTITATDANNCTGNRAYTLMVNDALPSLHDLAVVKLKAPKKVTLKDGTAPKPGKLSLSIQNLGATTETITNAAALDALLNLQITSLGGCTAPVPTRVSPVTFPVVLAPKKKLTVSYTVTITCANDPLASSKTEGHADYRYTVALDHSAVDAQPDAQLANNGCPRAASGTDKGCAKGLDVLTDVIVK